VCVCVCVCACVCVFCVCVFAYVCVRMCVRMCVCMCVWCPSKSDRCIKLLGSARTKYIRCIYSIFGREITIWKRSCMVYMHVFGHPKGSLFATNFLGEYGVLVQSYYLHTTTHLWSLRTPFHTQPIVRPIASPIATLLQMKVGCWFREPSCAATRLSSLFAPFHAQPFVCHITSLIDVRKRVLEQNYYLHTTPRLLSLRAPLITACAFSRSTICVP
jgi:hypothetical protein